ncbi:Glutathione S-transferase 1, isoform D [Polyplax serrata]|uniref:Glutathione S-transferase 1, isoform D n=1 Tax=Polyplax serrata TaxID=468196 RepID=A0AAN8PDL8_POLSC
MPIDYYYVPGSSPCRAVLLTAKALGLEMNLKITDLMKGEHMTPEFLKMNPQHTIPTINDNGFCLWESRAIMAYLVNQYGKNDQLYPKDPKQRALVDQRLYFDAGTLYQRFGDLYYPIMFGGAPMDPAKQEKLDQAFEFFNTFLEGQTWAAGSSLTIADLSLAASVATCEAVGYPVSKYPNVQAWYSRVQKEAPGYEVNSTGAEMFKQLYQSLTSKK